MGLRIDLRRRTESAVSEFATFRANKLATCGSRSLKLTFALGAPQFFDNHLLVPTQRLFRVYLSNLLLVSWRLFHHNRAVSESWRVLLQLVAETRFQAHPRARYP